MKNCITGICLWLTAIIGELHSLFPDGPATYNWIWHAHVPMTLNWNVWFLGVNTQILLLFIAIRFWKPNKHNDITLRVFTYFAIVDYFLYFYNWKTVDYGYIYLAMIGMYFFLWYKKNITIYLWKKLGQLINPYR